MTLAFSARVGESLAEIPEDIHFREEYRFYMWLAITMELPTGLRVSVETAKRLIFLD